MMPILVRSDDVRCGRKAKARHGRPGGTGVNVLGRSRENFLTLIFFLKILQLKDGELVMSEMKKMGGHRLRFGENMPGRTPKSE